MAVEEAKQAATGAVSAGKSTLNLAWKATTILGATAVIGAGATAALAADPSATILSTAWETAKYSLGNSIGGLPEIGQVIGNTGQALGELASSFE